ncbi:AHH domain-containing protein [Pyxidicoccus sp. 3LG]
MSEKQHQEDIDDDILKKLHSSSGGGACLNRHIPKVEKGNFCSHRWQAYVRALKDKARYDWPKYKPLAQRGGKVQTAAGKDKKGQLFPPWYSKEIDAPSEVPGSGTDKAGTWDLAHSDNFQVKCYRPYWHESNHIIPNSTLKKVLASIGEGMKSPHRVRRIVRARLLEQRYNLNHEDNMILLPMDEEVARVLGLPRHRKTAFLRSHKAYSDNVEKELKGIFSSLKDQIREHSKPKPDYGNFKNSLVEFSKRLYGQIIAAGEKDGAGALDDMSPERFKAPSNAPTDQGMGAGDF